MKQTYANAFVDRSTTLWNGINTHPSQIEVYGKKLLDVATTCSLLGLKIVAKYHLVITDKSHKLLKASRKPQLKIDHAPNHKVAVSVTVPTGGNHFSKPEVQEVQNAFYELLHIAISGIWRDGSELTASQTRFLMHLSGVKIKQANVVISGFQAMIKDIESHNDEDKANENVQSMCAFIPLILSKMKSPKRAAFLQLVTHQLSNELGALTTKENYISQIKHLQIQTPEEIKQMPIPNLPSQIRHCLHEVEGKPAHTFIIVKQGFQYRAVYGRDLIKIAKTFIYFLD